MSAPKKRTGTIGRAASGRIAAFAPTDQQRDLVQKLAGVGVTHEEIIACVPWGRPDGKPISAMTLRKHFRDELDRGVAVANAKVKRRLFQMAEDGNLGAAIFWLKARCGWRETTVVENTGPNGQPLPVAPIVQLYLPRKETPEEQDDARRKLGVLPVEAVVIEPSRPALTWPDPVPPADDKPIVRAIGHRKPLDPHIERAFRIDAGPNVR